jgi:superfamily II DNA or RNA helicase
MTESLPHQITAVYESMLTRDPLRFLLADDPGAGKTIMTGLLIKELILRGDLKRCLIVSPGSLTEQWQDELLSRFQLNFSILTTDEFPDLCIARLDKLSRSDELFEKLKQTDWDLIICDEAHKLSTTFNGNEEHHTRRYKLGLLLYSITRHFLLLIAMPHNSKDDESINEFHVIS